MAVGPLQLLVVAFDEPHFTGAITEELNRLRKSDLIRLLDVLVVIKDQDGTVTAAQVSDLSVGEAEDVGMSAAGPCDRDRRGVRAGARSSRGAITRVPGPRSLAHREAIHPSLATATAAPS